MAGNHPIYVFEYDIEIKKLKNGLEHFIDKINQQNEYYRTEMRQGFTYDIIHFEVKKESINSSFLITVKLFYTYSNIDESLLFQLFENNDIEYLEKRNY